MDLSDVVFSKDHRREIVRTNEEQERNVVPLEEALEVSDKDELRNLMLQVAQNDYRYSLRSMAKALGSEDSETAHYAASVLQDALGDFRSITQRQYQKIMQMGKEKEISTRADLIFELLDYIDEVLLQHVLSDKEQKEYTIIMDTVLELVWNSLPDRITSKDYEQVSLRLLEIKEFERCSKWCIRAKEVFPNTLATYTALIKYYFMRGQREQFFATLEELKASSIVIDQETLELIRTFQ